MTETVDVGESTLAQRVVLVGLASLAETGDVPAHAGEVRRVCTERLDAVEGDVVGTLSEAAVARALKELEAAGLLASTRDATSATGKGRPRYELDVNPDSLLSSLAEDDRVSGLVEQVSR